MRLDTIFTNGRFHTLDDARPTATRIGVLAGTIVAVDEDLDGCSARETVDLGGATAVPGFNDAHHHLSMRGQRLSQLDLGSTSVDSLDALYAAVGRYAERLPADAWLIAFGYDQNKLGGEHPRRDRIDELTGGRPAFLGHTSCHMGVVNTPAIRAMGYADPRLLPDVANGHVGRDPDGIPTGLLGEQAQNLIYAVIRPAPVADFCAGLRLASDAALAEGITSITEPGLAGQLAGNGPADVACYQRALEAGQLRVRATVMPESNALHPLPGVEHGTEWLGLDLGIRSGLGDEWLRVGAVKVFADGSLIGRTAAMCCDYADSPGNRGFLQTPVDQLTATIVEAHRAGWQVATHAIGDDAVSAVLDAIELAQRRYPRVDPRHRLEHAGVTSTEQVARIAELGVIPVPQGRFITETGDGFLAALGPDRVALAYRQKSFLDAGIEVPGSSDCPVVASAPLLGIHAMVNRTTASGEVLNPAECVSPAQALRAFTVGSAYAEHQDHRKGRLARGMLADFAVLSEDLLAVDPATIDQLEVTLTVVGGEVRYHRS